MRAVHTGARYCLRVRSHRLCCRSPPPRRARPDPGDRADDAPLRDDIRLLGRVLGEVIGEQAVLDVLELVESTRVEAFRIRRSETDRAELAHRLGGLDIRSANHVIRAFSHFSLLANLAEDLHHERRRRFHRREGSPPQAGSLAAAFQALDAAGPRRRRRWPAS